MVSLINEHPPDIFVRPYSVHETSRKAKLQINMPKVRTSSHLTTKIRKIVVRL